MRVSRVVRVVSWLASTSVLASLALTSTASAGTPHPGRPGAVTRPAVTSTPRPGPHTRPAGPARTAPARTVHSRPARRALSPTRAAQLQAMAADAPVEVPSGETDSTRLFANPDGSFTLNSYAGVVQVNRGGGWLPVDTTLAVAGGVVTPKVAEGGQRFSAGGIGPLATLSRGGSQLQVGWPGSLPAPVLSGNTATYRGVLPGADLVVTAGPDGFEFSVVYRSRPAAAPVLDIPLGPCPGSPSARTATAR